MWNFMGFLPLLLNYYTSSGFSRDIWIHQLWEIWSLFFFFLTFCGQTNQLKEDQLGKEWLFTASISLNLTPPLFFYSCYHGNRDSRSDSDSWRRGWQGGAAQRWELRSRDQSVEESGLPALRCEQTRAGRVGWGDTTGFRFKYSQSHTVSSLKWRVHFHPPPPPPLSADSTLYLAGGEFPDGSASREMWRYDPCFDSWIEMAPMNVARSELGEAVSCTKY